MQCSSTVNHSRLRTCLRALIAAMVLIVSACQAEMDQPNTGATAKGSAEMTAGFKPHSSGEAADRKRRRAIERASSETPRQIFAYTGYGNGEKLWVKGRILANKPIGEPGDDDNWWDNLRATYQRWETDELEGVRVELEYAGTSQVVWSDDEGYYDAEFDVVDSDEENQTVVARVETGKTVLEEEHAVMIVDPDASFMIISDMDDTVIHTGITTKLRAAHLTFLHNAKTRKPLDGVAGLYRELVDYAGDESQNPVFYVSNSGWNMYDVLEDFIELNDIPRGPLLLRDLGGTGDRSTKNHKAETFRTLLERFPHLPAVLIGDSGQHDAELYQAVAKEFPGRVLGIYIRDVDPGEESDYDLAVDTIIRDGSVDGVPMIRGENSDAFASHMRSIGLLSSDEQEQVADSVERDEQREDL